MAFDNGAANRETNPHACDFTADERLKQPLGNAVGEAWTIVTDLDDNAPGRVALGADPNLPWHVMLGAIDRLSRIANKVQKNLLDLRTIDHHGTSRSAEV